MLKLLLDIANWLFGRTPTVVASEAGMLSKEMLAKEIPLTLAGMSGAVGAVVVVFVLFGLQNLEHENVEEFKSRAQLPLKREIAAIRLLLTTSSIAMSVLLVTPIFLLYNLTTQALMPGSAVAIGLATFSFSVTTLIVGLLSYFIIATFRARAFDELDVNLAKRATGSAR
jgi:hypothetical protein